MNFLSSLSFFKVLCEISTKDFFLRIPARHLLTKIFKAFSSLQSKAVRGLRARERTSQSKSRRSSSSKKSKKSKVSTSTIEPGFELVCNDVESLRGLCEKFAEQPPTTSRRKSGGRPPTRKRCEKELHSVLSGLVEDLARNDARYSRAKVKGMINLMRDWKSVEPDSGTVFTRTLYPSTLLYRVIITILCRLFERRITPSAG